MCFGATLHRSESNIFINGSIEHAALYARLIVLVEPQKASERSRPRSIYGADNSGVTVATVPR